MFLYYSLILSRVTEALNIKNWYKYTQIMP